MKLLGEKQGKTLNIDLDTDFFSCDIKSTGQKNNINNKIKINN